MAFLKFIDKKGADSFISGIVQFGRLKEYLYIEKKKCVGKNDEMEGKYYTTKYQTPQGKGVNFTIDANKQKRNFALCLYHLNNKYSTSRVQVIQITEHTDFTELGNSRQQSKLDTPILTFQCAVEGFQCIAETLLQNIITNSP